MKKITIFLAVAFSAGLLYCGGGKEKAQEEVQENLERFAKYRVNITEATDLKKWVATVNKAEGVTVIKRETITGKNGKEQKLALVRLSDDKEGWLEERHLAKLPVFFIQEVTVYRRPNNLSQIVIKLPKGSIAFIEDEKDDWAQIFAGKVNGTWVINRWVQRSSFDTDTNVLRQALDYEKALALLNENKIDKALEKFDELKENSSLIGELASQKYDELTGNETPGGATPGGEGLPEDSGDDATDSGSDTSSTDDSSSSDVGSDDGLP